MCEGILAYVGKASGDYDPLLFRRTVTLDDVELSEDVYIVTKETAEAYLKSKAKPQVVVQGPETPTAPPKPGETITPVTPAGQTGQTGDTGTVSPPVIAQSDAVAKLTWTGAVPSQKWILNFYTKVLSKFAGGKGLTLTVTVEAEPDGGIPIQKSRKRR